MADLSERRESGAGAARRGRIESFLQETAMMAGGAGRLRKLALGLSAAWLVVVLAYAAGLLFGPGPEETGRPITVIDVALLALAVLAPVTLTLFGLAASSILDRLSAEAKAVREELAVLRQTRDARPARGVEQEARKLLNEMQAERAALAEVLREAAARARAGELGRARPEPEAEAAPAAESPAAPPTPPARPAAKTRPPVAPTRAPAGESQPALPLDPPPADARPELDWEAMVLAMEFPESETDRVAIEALYKVLPDPMAARLMQSAEDVLTVLAGQGVFMDDLEAATTTVEDWGRYLDGARGAAAGAVGAITDPEAMEKTRGRLKRDGVFHDAALHFLLRYDAIAKRARAETGGDDHAPRMARTRTGKAYALLTRALGRFDR